MLVAVALFSAMDALLKLLVERYPPMQVTTLRGLASLPFLLLPFLIRGRWHRLQTRRWHWHLGRARYRCRDALRRSSSPCKRLSLADTYSIFMCAPLLIAALSVPLLREQVATGQWIAIARRPGRRAGDAAPEAPDGRPSADWPPCCRRSAMRERDHAARAVALRHERKPGLLVHAVPRIGAGLLALPGWRSMLLSDLPLIVGIGFLGATAQHLITEAFRSAPASVVAPFEYTALLWGVLLDLVIWNVLPGAITLVGGAVVICAGLYLIARERREQSKTSAQSRLSHS